MKVKSYTVLERAVEEGIKLGLNRAHKHTDNPSIQQLEEDVLAAVMNAVCEVFSFDDENDHVT
ncbi:MAG: hypothetical protein EBR82_16280 [Caulobacteraceae bacterium]|jgi:hypothetical protein|nr:hypothetical protein [Caulobacteraceae bacterium]